jgi:hypothetical protein
MVRNWQARVENAEARRQEARQRKHKTEEKRGYKTMVQELFSSLDRHVLNIRRKVGTHVIHIWSDKIPADDGALLEEDGARKGKSRSNSVSEKTVKKKAHPRSKESAADQERAVDEPTLCKYHFFGIKCGTRKGGCRNVHYQSPYKTLADVAGKATPDSVLQSETAVKSEETMEMVYYFSLTIPADPDASISDFIAEALGGKELGVSNVVYVALDDLLIFDRYRMGLVLQENEFLKAFLGEDASRGRKISVGSENDHDEELFHLPGSILEYIITFLPDSAVAATSQVCKSWHYEIGRSPHLWRYLLERHQWPLPELLDVQSTSGENPSSTCRILREAFLTHYAAIRNVTAIQSGIAALMSRKTANEKELSLLDFSKRRNGPMGDCVGVEVWSPKRILAAYQDDCSLRLFEALPKIGGAENICRELICLRVDPYRHTKKRVCSVESMGLDDTAIGCVCHVLADGLEIESYILILLSRDDFLLGDNSAVAHDAEEAVYRVVDIGRSILDHMQCMNVEDHPIHIIDFLSYGNDLCGLQVASWWKSPSQSLQAKTRVYWSCSIASLSCSGPAMGRFCGWAKVTPWDKR